MNNVPFLYLACILAGFALVKLPAVSFLAGLSGFFTLVGVAAIIIFSFALLYYGLKALFNR